MTTQERIEAALAALPMAHVEEWETVNDRGLGFWVSKYGLGETKEIKKNMLILRYYSPDLAAEVLRLRAELAELKRWRDPVKEPPEKTGFYNCIDGKSVSTFIYNKELDRWFNERLLRAYTKGWMPLPEVPHD